jgi:hypothetical protein
VILEKVKLPSRIKEEDIIEDLARRLRGYSHEIVASDIKEWKRVPAPKQMKRVSITITFHDESKSQKLCEMAERTHRGHELSRSLSKNEKEHNRLQWELLNSKNMLDPDNTKVWLPEFEKGVIVKINEYTDTLERRQIMKEVFNRRMQGKEYMQMIPDPPL